MLHTEFQSCLWAVRSEHVTGCVPPVRGPGWGVVPLPNTNVQERAVIPTQETQKQGMVQDVSKRITTGPHGLRELWAPTVEKFLLMPLNCAQLLHVLENRLLVMQQRAAMENHPWRFHALCILQTRNRHRVNKHKKTRAEQTLNGSSRSNPPKTEHSGNGKT